MLKGSILQIALWSHFSIVVSLFRRIRHVNCQDCSVLYTYPTAFLSFFFVVLFIYFIYRVWKIVAEHEICFDNRTDDDYIIEDQPTLLGSKKIWKIVNTLLTPWSKLIAYTFDRLFPVKPQDSPSVNVQNGEVEEACNHDLETPVEDIIYHAAQKIEHREEDVRAIVSMLKGNWYNTVADLRTLTAIDAKKLNIPYRLYKAIQQELPQNEDPQPQKALDSLVQTMHKEKVVGEFGCLASDYRRGYQYFKMDELLIRNLLFALIDAILAGIHNLRLVALLIFQIWWIFLLMWNRPYLSQPIFASKMVAECSLLAVIAIFVNLETDVSRFWSFIVTATLHIVVLLSCFILPLGYRVFAPLKVEYRKLDNRSIRLSGQMEHPFVNRDIQRSQRSVSRFHWF